MQQVKLIEKSDHFVLRLNGKFTGGSESKLLKQALLDIAVDEKNKVYLDLQEVEYITSTIIGMFVTTNNLFQTNRGSMIFFCPNAYINELFKLTKLTDFIPTCYNLSELNEALEAA